MQVVRGSMRARRLITRFFAVLIICCLVVVALEGMVRLVRPQLYFSTCVNQWDKDVGTKLIPGINGFLRCPEYSVNAIINSKGLRDREFTYEKPANTRRIICLGDSFTFGYGVQEKKTFSKLLEQFMNEGPVDGNRWEVLNAGIGSTGTANQLALLETECYKYSPDIVVVCFCPANDFFDNITCGLYSLEGGALVKHPAPRTGARVAQGFVRFIPAYGTLCAKSHLVNLVRYRVTALHYRVLNRRATKSMKHETLVVMHNELTYALVDALHRACVERGSELVVMFIPPPQVGESARWTGDLIGHCEKQGIPSLDLTACFATARENGMQTAYRNEGHWNENGHAIAARALHDFLLQRGAISDRSGAGRRPEGEVSSKPDE